MVFVLVAVFVLVVPPRLDFRPRVMPAAAFAATLAALSESKFAASSTVTSAGSVPVGSEAFRTPSVT